MPTNSEAIRLAEASDWRGLQRLIEKAPEYAQEMGDYGMLPIHWACTESHVPVTLLIRLLAAYPEGAKLKNDAELLPLHIAIRARVEPDWLEKLLEVYPESVHVDAPENMSVMELADHVGLDMDCIKVLHSALERCPNQEEDSESDQPEMDEDWQNRLSPAGLSKITPAIHGGAIVHPSKQISPVSPAHSLRSAASSAGGRLSSPRDQLVSPSSSSSSEANSVCSAPIPRTVAPLHKQMAGPFQRKHSLDYLAHAAAAAAAARQHQEMLMRSRLVTTHAQQQSMSRLGSRHQSLPVIPSFEHIKFDIQQYAGSSNHSSDEEDNNRQGRRSSVKSLGGSRSKKRNSDPPRDARNFESPPEWKRDDECSICRASFGVFKHRHHCRNCGKSICSQHSADKKLTMESKGFTTPQRVCVTCYAMITHKQSTQSNQFDPLLDGATISGPVAAFHLQQQWQQHQHHQHSPSIQPAPTGNGLSCGDSMFSLASTTASTAPSAMTHKEKSVETWLMQNQMNELRHLVAQQQKQIEHLTQTNMQMQQQILEQEELKAETMLLITQLMTRVSVLELEKTNSMDGRLSHSS
ncbi:hypothetical protein Poli38472_000183 [Pythium oligandrum]|uniref:FYVE-type domain-containing protein n=1 Tax=Pythium oligandrum TaxID=41045 RepID=A0A8K1CB96_PYTOL|nr:hypothetical protein Poli38472_000183 [Pythium oligandrum]|eukprot:TMW60141.1 hypothetical protein Poli38472_000183 [Pythium oligandrum]